MSLENMTADKWNKMTPAERESARDYSSLSPQLRGLEYYRVEAETTYGEKRRFIVGTSTGWKPIHLEISRRNALGGVAAEKEYKSVKVLYKAK